MKEPGLQQILGLGQEKYMVNLKHPIDQKVKKMKKKKKDISQEHRSRPKELPMATKVEQF